ncbi:MAG: hypothetical protein WD960_15095 [Gemmatimonadota bacterium]
MDPTPILSILLRDPRQRLLHHGTPDIVRERVQRPPGESSAALRLRVVAAIHNEQEVRLLKGVEVSADALPAAPEGRSELFEGRVAGESPVAVS